MNSDLLDRIEIDPEEIEDIRKWLISVLQQK
jgi:hypothetical protein